MPDFDLGGGFVGAVAGRSCQVVQVLVLLFWQGDWVLGYHSVGFGLFPDIF